ncbi:hypothetical protein [Tessaracoccus sp. Y1736]
MVTNAEVEEILALGHELRSFEVKGPGNRTDKAFCAKVARATMALANIRDGGQVCLGIDETNMTAMMPGLDRNQLAAWSDYDGVHDALARYSDPPVAFAVHPLQLSNGVDVVVLEVSEFDQVPHICKRDYQGELQNGATYVRPRGKPQSIAVPSVAEMRDLLDLATTKGVREFVRRVGDAGLGLGAVQSVDEAARTAFATEAEAAWADPSQALESILSKGHFDVSVRPDTFDTNRVSPNSLEALVVRNAVRLRGWPVPYVDYRSPILRHGTWIGQDIAPQGLPHSEAWRVCTSGQFLHRCVFSGDLGERDADAMVVRVWEILFYLVEVAEFGARAAATLQCESITIDVALNGIAGRRLISGDWARELDREYLIHANRLTASETCSTTDLMRNPRGVGVTLSQTLFSQFGLKVPDQVLIDWQEKTLRS